MAGSRHTAVATPGDVLFHIRAHRFNMPFGSVGTAEFGTYFIGYARGPEVIEEMLRNVLIGKPPGNYDRILDFSMPLTGNLFFVPTHRVPRQPTPTGAITAAVDRIGRS